MCLAVPMKLIDKNEDKGVVEFGGITYNVNLSLVPDAAINNYVIVHAGFAIEILDEIEAEETLNLFSEMIDD